MGENKSVCVRIWVLECVCERKREAKSAEVIVTLVFYMGYLCSMCACEERIDSIQVCLCVCPVCVCVCAHTFFFAFLLWLFPYLISPSFNNNSFSSFLYPQSVNSQICVWFISAFLHKWESEIKVCYEPNYLGMVWKFVSSITITRTQTM